MIKLVINRGNVREILIKLGVAVAFSVAGFLYSRVSSKSIQPSSEAPPSEYNAQANSQQGSRAKDADGDLDSVPKDIRDQPHIRVRVNTSAVCSSPTNGHKFVDLLEEFDEQVAPVKMKIANKHEHEPEIRDPKNTMEFMREQERNLENQLLKHYGQNKHQATVMELQNRLKLNNMEIKILAMKIESLQADKKRLEATLGAAKDTIKMLKKTLRHEAEQNKEEVLALKKRVEALPDVESYHLKINDFEDKEEELRQESCDLVQRLKSTEMLSTSIMQETKIEEQRIATRRLREEKQILLEEVERLRADRCADAEELVYLRWINACLRYELRNYHPPQGKTSARDLSKNLSPKSEEKAKQLILEYANNNEKQRLENEPTIVNSSKPNILTNFTRHVPGHYRHSYHNHQNNEEESSAGAETDERDKEWSPMESHWLPSFNEEYDVMSRESGSSQSCVRFVLGKGSTGSSPSYRPNKESNISQKSELERYAEALKESPWMQRRASSSSAG